MLVATILAFLGLCFGSFVNALVWRIHTGRDWVRARSQCPKCHHELAWYDLVPLFSFLSLRGKCRYCHKPISWQYPIVEAATALTFVVSYYYWSGGVFGVGDWVLLVTWLATSVGLVALLVYDVRWMILPNRIIYPTLAIAASGRLIYILSFEPSKPRALAAWLLSVAIASGLFWIIFMVSRGRWIGYGDVRLGLILGTVLADSAQSVLMIFTAAVLGSLVAIPLLLSGKKSISSRLPFGPFLIVGTFFVLIYGQSVINWYDRLLK